MARPITPSEVMYSTLKSLKITNKDVARSVFTDSLSFGGRTPFDRIEDKTFLHRAVNAEPGSFSKEYFTDLSNTAMTLCSRISSNHAIGLTTAEIASFLSEEPSFRMRDSLKKWGLDDAYYANLIDSLLQVQDISPGDKSALVMLAFIATGCYGNPVLAGEKVQEFLKRIASSGFKTMPSRLKEQKGDNDSEYLSDPSESDLPKTYKLGIVRIIDGAMDLSNVHGLADNGDETIIGSLSSDKNAINDVGSQVSRRHVRIWQAEDGKWLVQDLGSTNGTKVIRGDDKSEVILMPENDDSASDHGTHEKSGNETDALKPSSRSRGKKRKSAPYEIKPGDALILAETTMFLVLNIR